MDSNHWNSRYATAEYVWKADPNIFLAAEAATLPPGRAVDLACVLADLEAAGIDVTVERSETVERVVAGAGRPALDCLVRVRR